MVIIFIHTCKNSFRMVRGFGGGGVWSWSETSFGQSRNLSYWYEWVHVQHFRTVTRDVGNCLESWCYNNYIQTRDICMGKNCKLDMLVLCFRIYCEKKFLQMASSQKKHLRFLNIIHSKIHGRCINPKMCASLNICWRGPDRKIYKIKGLVINSHYMIVLIIISSWRNAWRFCSRIKPGHSCIV